MLWRGDRQPHTEQWSLVATHGAGQRLEKESLLWRSEKGKLATRRRGGGEEGRPVAGAEDVSHGVGEIGSVVLGRRRN
jgi:hypothetical protein